MARPRLRARREEVGFSQEGLARALGMETSSIRRWENGTTTPQPWHRERIARALKVSREGLSELLAHIDSSPEAVSAESARNGGGDMRRRTFLAGIPLLATALTPNSLSSLEVEVSRMWSCYQDSRYQPIIDRIPGLLSQLQSHLISGPVSERRRSENALALAYQLSSTVLTKLGHHEPALSALDQGIYATQRSDNPVAAASIKRSKAHTLLAFGFSSEASAMVEETTSELVSTARDQSPNTLSVLGTLHLVGAVAASQERDTRRATELLDAAETLASELGRDANCLWTAFGPTNVAIHRVVIGVELGRVAEAVELASSIDTRSLPSERRVRHAIEVARAHTLLGQIDEAAAALISAESTAAEQVRHHRVSRQLVTSWLDQPRRREAVSSLAQRMHVEAA